MKMLFFIKSGGEPPDGVLADIRAGIAKSREVQEVSGPPDQWQLKPETQMLVYFLSEEEDAEIIKAGALQHGIGTMDPLGPEAFIEAATGWLNALHLKPGIKVRLKELLAWIVIRCCAIRGRCRSVAF